MSKTSQTDKQRLLTFLERNTRLSVRQAKSRFGIKNVSARIHELRTDGHPIDTTVKTYSSGKRKFFYTLGA